MARTARASQGGIRYHVLNRGNGRVHGKVECPPSPLYVDQTDGPTSRVHLAFQAADRTAVDRFYAAGLAAGGRDNGAPGERHYHPGYYAAFLFDPDGNNIEAVFHGPTERSAPSIQVRRR